MRTRNDGREHLQSQRLKAEARIIRVQRMTRKWGSCSTAGTITLAEDLVEQEAGFQDFVIAMSCCISVSHGRLFKALMTAHVPGWRQFEIERLGRQI
jgi:predicted metal-dependent hydrolase